MNQTITLAAKIAGRSLFAWLKVIIPGLIFSIICLIVSLKLLSDGDSPTVVAAAHTGPGAVIAFLLFLLTEFWSTLLFLAAIGGLIYYFTLANKQAVQTAIYQTWKQKLSDWIMNKFEAYLNKLNSLKMSRAKPMSDHKEVKAELLGMIKNDSSSSGLQKRVMRYLLQRIYLEDIDFGDPDLRLNTIVRTAVSGKLSDTLEPSLVLFWIALAVQIIVLILALVFHQQ